jgi:6-phosphogluconolactonase/glucosamine-6-phosphate isomerase/deaminase
MSLGPQQVLAASSVVVVARGPAKRELAERLLALDTFDPMFPISVVHHPEVRDRVEIVLATDVGIQL